VSRNKRRWSGEKDRHFGPFTWCFGDYWRMGAMLDSGGDDEGGTGCHVRFYFGTLTFICELPNWLPDYRIKHVPTSWDAATIARLGRNYYYEVFPREYGFSFDRECSLHVHYGPQTHDSTTTKSKCYFLPWANWRFIGQKWYGLNGELIRTGGHSFKEDYEFEQTMPTRTFEFDDFDGKRLTAKTHIEEREWRFGTGWCKWLSVFCKPKVRRSLSITFSDEVGPEKGSWKGGTIGTSIDMLPGELHEEAFKRFCEKDHRSKYRNYGIKYVGRIA
jgi:hypothetical protein